MSDFVDYRSEGVWHPTQVELREVVNGETKRGRNRRKAREDGPASSVIHSNEADPDYLIVHGHRKATVVRLADGTFAYREGRP